jgi:hypothetical protein
MVDSLLAALPWISVVRLLPHGERERSLADRESLDWLKQAVGGQIASLSTLFTAGQEDADQAVETLIRAWLGNLTRSATHHDVNNILGPLVLLDALGHAPFNSQLGPRALLQHARWLGLASAKKDGNHARWFDAGPLATELDRTIRFVLIDDQINNGWKDVIAAALSMPAANAEKPEPDTEREAAPDQLTCLRKSGGVEIWGTTSPGPALAKINALLQEAKDARFRLQFTPTLESTAGAVQAPPIEVLLLDLRLAPEKDAEIRYFRQVLQLAEDLNKFMGDSSWPWRPLPGASSDRGPSLKELQQWLAAYASSTKSSDIAEFQQSETYLILLTLFARIISTIDLSVPVIVFSSTGQRRITEELKGHGNVITAFEKPRFAGYRPSDVILEAQSRWEAAIARAASILRARSAMQRICANAPSLPVRIDPADDQRYLIDLYLDETGKETDDEGVTVGGLLVAGPRRKVEDFIAAVGREVTATCNAATGSLKKHLRTEAGVLAQGLQDLGAHHSVHVSLVSLSGALSGGASLESEAGAVEDELEADNLYRELVGMLTEIAIYHFVSHVYALGNDTAYRIYMPTRGREIKEAADERDARQLFADWGIQRRNVGDNRRLWDAVDALRLLDSPDPQLTTIRDCLNMFAEQKQLADPDAYRKTEFINFIDFDAARPIIQGVSRQYRPITRRPNSSDDQFRPKPEHARAYLLIPSIRDTARIHLLADTLLSALNDEAVKKIHQSGFAGEYCIDLRFLVAGVREASNGFIGEGLATAIHCPPVSSVAPPEDARRRLLGRLSQFAMAMSGAEFITLAERAQRTPMVKNGRVAKCRGPRCWIRISPEDQEIECLLPVRMGSRNVELERGDHVLVEVAGLSERTIAGLAFVRLLGFERHPRWGQLATGDVVRGRIDFAKQNRVRINLGEIDGYVDLQDAPSWGGACPPIGQAVDFRVIAVDPARRRLWLAPK